PFNKHRDTCSTECFIYTEAAFEKYGRETCAIILEPLLQGSAGMRIYPKEYLIKLREICNKYSVILIADEIATGFGRTGKMFAFDHACVSPDIMCISKGLTGGYMPMSITMTTDDIYYAFYDDYNKGKAFMHSHTYSGNPLGCAAANAVLDILKQDKVIENAQITAEYLNKKMTEKFANHKNIGEVRHIGLINAMELVEDKTTKKPFSADKRMGYQIYKKALENGLILRPLGNVLYFNPALIITKEQLDTAIETAYNALITILGE
ncbi:MAG: aspartate aminotransferase family protein, partial [Bacilli bacterium]